MQSQLLTAHQVGELLQLKVSSIYDAVAKGRIPAVKLWEGRRRAVIRFKAEDIQAFIDSKRAPASPSRSRT